MFVPKNFINDYSMGINYMVHVSGSQKPEQMGFEMLDSRRSNHAHARDYSYQGREKYEGHRDHYCSPIRNNHWRESSYRNVQRDSNGHYDRRGGFEMSLEERNGYQKMEEKYLEGENCRGRRFKGLGAYDQTRGNTDRLNGGPFAQKDHTFAIRTTHNRSCRPTWRTAPQQTRTEADISRDPHCRHRFGKEG